MRTIALVLLVLVGCRSREMQSTVRPEVRAPLDAPAAVVDASAPDVAPDVAPDPDVAPASGPWASAWTDPAAVARLAQDCRFHPPRGEYDEPDLLDCDADIEQQSCDFDPCEGRVSVPCRRSCGRSCRSCDTTCRGACTQCRAGCHDAACIGACATSCGACLQGCLAAKDRCLTAGCAARHEVCYHALAVRFATCRATCRRCSTSCDGNDEQMPCIERCTARGGGCTAEQGTLCAWSGPDFGADVLDAGAPAP